MITIVQGLLVIIGGFSIGTITTNTKTCVAFSLLTTSSSSAAAAAAAHATRTTAFPLDARAKSKWDNLEDDDDDDNDDGSTTPEDIAYYSNTLIPVPDDMLYLERNVKRAHDTFLNLRNSGGKEVCHDVYAKACISTNSESVLWYVCKVAKISDLPLEDCIARQWNMIEHHASNLRPIELKPHRSGGRVELWTAPGDSELDVAYNRPDLKMLRMKKNPGLTNKDVQTNLIGFQGEVYQDMTEEGFRTWRDEEGYPVRAEINPGGESRPPNEEEYAQLQKELNDRNISVEDLYKDQQKRTGLNE